jgi:hypothetical protein
MLIGGADSMSAGERRAVTAFIDRLVAYAERTNAAVVDGGTDSGVMRLLGARRRLHAATFPLVGVLPAGALERRTRDGRPIRPARSHTQLILVPGIAFGDETPWMFAAADHLAGGSAPAILLNGGRLAREEALARLEAGHAVIAVSGSGRTADELAADEALRASGRLRVVPLSADETSIAAAIEDGPGA